MPFVHLVDPMSQALPQWAIGLVLFVVCTLALEAGDWFGRRQRAQRSGTAETTHSSDAKDYIVSSVFRLLALLLGITFAMALDRFDSRVDWTAEEATALRTTYFRAEMLNEPHRSQLQAT
ncbi:MAG TPA: hypothetical protein VFO36_09500, partial [Nitrospiraceae bacterium]|nr:hypothetical protein [Nitrospiraceae bacterium]